MFAALSKIPGAKAVSKSAPKAARTPSTRLALGQSNQAALGRSPQRTPRPPDAASNAESSARALQPKLIVGAVDDPLEHEADRAADQVMRTPDGAFPVASGPAQISRKCADCEEEEAKTLRAKPAGTALSAFGGTAPALVHEALRAAGQPLDPVVRRFMEPRFGRDFGEVRVHADAQAARSARAVNARAFTVGKDIVFGAGQYAAGSADGQRLLAHELVHTVQQGAAPGVLQRDAEPDAPCPPGQMRMAKGLPCFSYMPGRECPIGQIKFAGQCVPWRPRPSLLDQKLTFDPTLLRPPNVSPPGTSTGTTGAPAGKGTPTPPGSATAGCTYSITFGKPKEVDCDTAWQNDPDKKKKTHGPLCGKQWILDITSVSVSPGTCPLAGLQLSEIVATVPSTFRCTPAGFKWPPPSPCTIGPGGKLTGCTDTLTMCGLTSDLRFGGCEEVVEQTILVDGNPVEKHTIKFELDVRDGVCTGATVTRK